MVARNCIYCAAPDELVEVDPKTGKQTEIDTTRVDAVPDHAFLCTWADNSPEGVKVLAFAPRWLQREALAGHLMRSGDCTGCRCFKARET